ncbi:2-oxoacid:acceptor oxidoreductase, gamma subunit,pyruvate/2-ketoisovalerate [Moorella glycerini]|uniref:NADH-dependent phenylglyoxylate dehydrogenase subunit gamma n=1 Tax=Neomoorella stamsii TaxID=1266720 RepID=A0A9X7P7L2_9FIRM|nr:MULTISPECIES: 2-oxoacid:acceptor oxidoreductase family protein [Moorella]PRR77599.1 NADH-dependent phenylglyoxylate dehydrogenase subunit gamma [Moorella stamsii]CEP69354.1 2-oxoacid:acceptor oxidoreductase, gamma subunit,pyruvate/2-ketoisovalerate [Moorella glycerini]
MLQIRWHGRGGQGAVTAARIFGLAAALYGSRYAQSFPSFGTERRGAPVTAFTRLDEQPIRDRSQIYNPDYVVVLDATLLDSTDVFAGLATGGTVLINAGWEVVTSRVQAGARVYYLDATRLAREVLGVPIVNTAMVAALAGVSGLLSLEAVEKAIADVLPEGLAAKNISVARQAFALAKGLVEKEAVASAG